MIGRHWRAWRTVALFLLAGCAGRDATGHSGSDGNGGGTPPPLEPAEFSASANPTPPAGYTIASEQSYKWQAYIRYADAWVAVGSPQSTADVTADLVIDCNTPEMHDACTLHLPGLILLSVTQVTPSARLCAYKGGFLWHDGLLLFTPVGSLGVAPVAASSLDPGNAGICYP